MTTTPEDGVLRGPNAPDPDKVPKPEWWASPKLLGGVSIGIVIVLSIIFH